jgi:hypothetical protein
VYSSDYSVFSAYFFSTAILEAVEYFSAKVADPEATNTEATNTEATNTEATNTEATESEATHPTDLD